MHQVSRWEGKFRELREELARLEGWAVTCEHELVVLERICGGLFPNNIVPYLDFLREQNIRCNPHTFYTALICELQGSPEQRSDLFNLAVSASLRVIGNAYVKYIRTNEVMACLAPAEICNLINSHILQSIDLIAHPFRYGNPMEAEAAFSVSEKLIRMGAPNFATQLALDYDQFSMAVVGCRRITEVLYNEGMNTLAIGEGFIDHWKRYIASTGVSGCGKVLSVPD
jgi:hypothetical protein